jgi:hypothetical protein
LANPDASAVVRQGLERHPGEVEAEIFVIGRRLTKEAHVPITKIRRNKPVYSGKPGCLPNNIEKSLDIWEELHTYFSIISH